MRLSRLSAIMFYHPLGVSIALWILIANVSTAEEALPQTIASGDSIKSAQELVERCFAREERLTAGHIEFTLEPGGIGNPPPGCSGTYYFEWSPGGKFRIGASGDSDSLIAVSDGDMCYTADGYLWENDLIVKNDGALYNLDAPPTPLAVTSKCLYDNVTYRLLHPIKMDIWRDFADLRRNSKIVRLPFDSNSEEWRWLGEDQMAADRAGSLMLVDIGVPSALGPYALDFKTATPLVQYYKKSPGANWNNLFEISPGLWFPGSVSGENWGWDDHPTMTITVLRASSKICPVAADRFDIPASKVVATIRKASQDESMLDRIQPLLRKSAKTFNRITTNIVAASFEVPLYARIGTALAGTALFAWIVTNARRRRRSSKRNSNREQPSK